MTKKGLKTIIKAVKPTKEEDKKILEKVIDSINIAKAMNEPLWLGDKNHKTIYVNPVYEALSGYSLKECIGKPADFCFDEKSKRIIAEHHGLRKKGVSSQYEATILSKTGKRIPVLVSGAPTETGGTIGIFINLTLIKKLKEQQQMAEQIIRNSTDAIVILDEYHKIKMWNTGATKIFGYKESEVLDKHITSLLIPPDLKEENKSLVEEVEEKKFIKNFETKRKTKTGDKRDVSLSITKVTDRHGSFIGYLVTYHDITHRKRVNTELQKRFEAIQDAFKELGIQRRQSDYMYEIVEMAISKDGLENIGKLIVSAACMLTKCDGAVLRIFDKKRKILQLYAHLGVSPQWLDKSKITFENSLAEDAYKTGRPIIIQNIDSTTKHRGIKLVKEHGFKALILIPFIIENELIGTLSMYAKDAGKFRLIETDFLERFGQQCSLALAIKIAKKK